MDANEIVLPDDSFSTNTALDAEYYADTKTVEGLTRLEYVSRTTADSNTAKEF